MEQETRSCERTNARRVRSAILTEPRAIAAVIKPKVRSPRTDGRSIDVEIAHCEKLLRDLRCGIVNLRKFHARDFDFDKQLLKHAAKIRSVEEKLNNLKHGRLL